MHISFFTINSNRNAKRKIENVLKTPLNSYDIHLLEITAIEIEQYYCITRYV